MYELVDINGHVFELRGRPGTKWFGLNWSFQRDENCVLEGVAGKGLSKESGEIRQELFGKARIYEDHQGSVIISQYRMAEMYELADTKRATWHKVVRTELVIPEGL